MRTLVAAAGVATALASSCPAVHAADVTAATLQAGPVLAGDSLLYARSEGGDAVVLRVPLAGGAATELTRKRSAAVDDIWYVHVLAASPDAFAFRVAEIETGKGGGTAGYEVLAALRGEAVTAINECSTYGRVAVLGHRVLFDDCGVSLVEIGPGASRERLAGPAAHGVRAAGHFAVWRDGRHLVVFDLDARRVVYRLGLRRVRGRLRGYDVQADGTLVAAFERRGRLTLAFRSPRGSRLRTLEAPSAPQLQLRAARGRVALLRYRHFEASRARLTLVDGRGRVTTISTRAHAKPYQSFDFDGRRLAWTERTSGGLRFRVAPVR